MVRHETERKEKQVAQMNEMLALDGFLLTG